MAQQIAQTEKQYLTSERDVVDRSKKCTCCKVWKPRTSFCKNRAKFDGLSGECRECSKARVSAWQKDNPALVTARSIKWNKEHPERRKSTRLHSRYEITLDQFNWLLASQGGGCAICSQVAPKMVVDHDHITEKVRGILCHSCNIAIGHFRDNTLLLTKAIAYLQK